MRLQTDVYVGEVGIEVCGHKIHLPDAISVLEAVAEDCAKRSHANHGQIRLVVIHAVYLRESASNKPSLVLGDGFVSVALGLEHPLGSCGLAALRQVSNGTSACRFERCELGFDGLLPLVPVRQPASLEQRGGILSGGG